MRNRKRPYAERTFSRNRTISARKSAGTKRPRNHSQASVDKTMHGQSPPMDFRARFQDIDDCFGGAGSGMRRLMSGGVPLAKKYT